jgi:hypothetical protein
LPVSATLPVWALALGGTAIGFVLGGIATWSAGGKARAEARAQRWKAESLSRDLLLEKEKVRKLEKAAKTVGPERQAAASLPSRQ